MGDSISHGERFSEFELKRRWPKFDEKILRKIYINLVTNSSTFQNKNHGIFKEKNKKKSKIFKTTDEQSKFIGDLAFFLDLKQQINGAITFWTQRTSIIQDVLDKLYFVFK